MVTSTWRGPPGRRPAASASTSSSRHTTCCGCGCGCGADSEDGAGSAPSSGPPVRPPAYQQHPPGPAPTRTARLTDPESPAVAYLGARETAADATAPPRRAEAYMDPDNPERGLGQPVWDAPPQGTVRKPVKITTKTVRREGTKTVVRATYTLALVGTTRTTTEDTAITTYLVCEQQPDGTWLVTKETPDLAP
ncbi:hypothetical protein [Streptomyces sp. MJP52]|uniref:hypothetical protein n=1 Tax=Streptomyces sp. MJP52 TaxID=2940555 RepID=UPI0024734892|nr:hypothetical protein [Streptomyces sp. MJP52]MDH6228878.1 hypothetical protein [Streptomyces sp. MJP52]